MAISPATFISIHVEIQLAAYSDASLFNIVVWRDAPVAPTTNLGDGDDAGIGANDKGLQASTGNVGIADNEPLYRIENETVYSIRLSQGTSPSITGALPGHDPSSPNASFGSGEDEGRFTWELRPHEYHHLAWWVISLSNLNQSANPITCIFSSPCLGRLGHYMSFLSLFPSMTGCCQQRNGVFASA